LRGRAGVARVGARPRAPVPGGAAGHAGLRRLDADAARLQVDARRHHRRLLPLMDSLGAQRFHLVSAKIGGVIARALAARRPERVKTLTVIGSPPPPPPPTGRAAARARATRA